MGGLKIDTEARVLRKGNNQHIPGLFGAGEVNGGVHGINCLGGSSLLDCVVFGRVSGATAAKFLLSKRLAGGYSVAPGVISANNSPFVLRIDPTTQRITMEVSLSGSPVQTSTAQATRSQVAAGPATAASAPAPAAPAKRDTNTPYSVEEVAKHNKDDDCWVIVNGRVLDVTKFLDDHPGGRKAIMLYAGKDATEEFNMLHEENVVEKYAPQVIIGVKKQ
jgi:cytochrome b involved in lipid metabolism